MNRSQTRKEAAGSGGIQFYLDIRYHQHHSWQGTIQRLDSGETIPFRSEMELLSLMEEAVKQQLKQDEDQRRFRSWKTSKEVSTPGKGKHSTGS